MDEVLCGRRYVDVGLDNGLEVREGHFGADIEGYKVLVDLDVGGDDGYGDTPKRGILAS